MSTPPVHRIVPGIHDALNLLRIGGNKLALEHQEVGNLAGKTFAIEDHMRAGQLVQKLALVRLPDRDGIHLFCDQSGGAVLNLDGDVLNVLLGHAVCGQRFIQQELLYRAKLRSDFLSPEVFDGIDARPGNHGVVGLPSCH